jgi:hypothetical protein
MHPLLEGLVGQHRDAEAMLRNLSAVGGRVRGFGAKP